MCGIAGYFGPDKIDEARLTACKKLMRRRGPDNAAHRHWVNKENKNIYLLHSRLSIIDLDPRANQPWGANGKWIAFNGELYNYLEIRKELEKKGIAMTTASDTEVLLRAIDTFDWKVLDQLEGMWAFAVYDEKDGTLSLCRDRFGEKPLYVHRDEQGGLYFGSEAKFIFALLGRRLKINEDQLCRYLVNGYKALYKGRHTFFQGLEEVAARTVAHIGSNGAMKTDAYWVPRIAPDEAMSYEKAVTNVRESLIRAVELRLRADVPLAFCMSGGVDSNSLISIAKRIFNYDVHGFTVLNSDSRYDEAELVEYAVNELKIKHASSPVESREFISNLKMLIEQHDAPVYTVTYFAHWRLMEIIAKAGYRISVSGTGADELFSGYYDHHLAYLAEIKSDPAFHERSLGAWRQHIQPLVRNPYLGDPDLFVKNSGFRDHIFLDASVFSSYLKNHWLEAFEEQKYTASLLRNRMMNEMFHESVPVILHEDDLNAMYYSIENRSPFLDRGLFDVSARIPTRHLIRDGYTKAVLRSAMEGIVPEKILSSRRKVGFNAPIESFLNTQDESVREFLWNDSPIYDLIDRSKIEALIAKGRLPNSDSKFLFNFVNSKIFLEAAA